MLRRLARTIDRKVATIDGSRVHIQTSVALGETMKLIPVTDACKFPDQPVEIHATETMFVMLDAQGQLHIADSTHNNGQHFPQYPSDVQYSRTYGNHLHVVKDEVAKVLADDMPHLTWQISALPHIKLLACGINHVLAVDEGNTIFARGCNTNGQLGLGNRPTRLNVFADIANRNARVERKIFFSEFVPCDFTPDDDDQIVFVGAGNAHSAFLTKSGDVWVCGEARACGFQHASHPTPQYNIDSFVHMNKLAYVESYRTCSCWKCTRYNNQLLAEMVADNDTAFKVQECYGVTPVDSLAVGRNFTAVKFADTNQIFSTNAWNDNLKTIAIRDSLRLRFMLLGTKSEFACSYDTPGDTQETQRHCISIFANAHSNALYASVVDVSSSMRMYNLLDKVKIINVNPELQNLRICQPEKRMHVRVDEIHSCWPDIGGMYVANFSNSVYYIHDQLTQTIDVQPSDAAQLEEHLLISNDHLLAWAMTQHTRLGVGIARTLTPDVHKLIYKAWFALCVPRVLGPQAMQTVRCLLWDQDLESLVHMKDA